MGRSESETGSINNNNIRQQEERRERGERKGGDGGREGGREERKNEEIEGRRASDTELECHGVGQWGEREGENGSERRRRKEGSGEGIDRKEDRKVKTSATGKEGRKGTQQKREA